MSDLMERFMRGWMSDDLEMILDACADDFVYDDPIDGRFDKTEFAEYYRSLERSDPVFCDVVITEADGEEKAWCWWAWKPAGATDWVQQGTSLSKATAEGVHSDVIAYYKR